MQPNERFHVYGEEVKENESMRRLLEKWEAGVSLDEAEHTRVLEYLDRSDLKPETCALLEMVVRDEGIRSATPPDPAPEAVVENIMDRIRYKRPVIHRVDRFFKIGLSIGAAAAGIALLIGATALLIRVLPTARQNTVPIVGNLQPDETPTTIVVRFELAAPDATSVYVVGDFNNWDTEQDRLTDSDKDGVWEVELRVMPNEVYTYNFLIDEEYWITDPSAVKHIRDSFGGQKSVLSL